MPITNKSLAKVAVQFYIEHNTSYQHLRWLDNFTLGAAARYAPKSPTYYTNKQ